MKIKLRRAQTIQPFGVGAIADFSGESFLVSSIDTWNRGAPTHKNEVSMPRLEQIIGGKKLRTFSGLGTSSYGRDTEYLRVSRFPRWYHCPRCKHLRFVHYAEDKENFDQESGELATPTCNKPVCRNQKMTPMRFVAYCDLGHLGEIDWFRWCHRGGDAANGGNCQDKSNLYFETSGRDGGDFKAMHISCRSENCGRKQSLVDVASGVVKPVYLQDFVQKGSTCCGKQPWQRSDDAIPCTKEMRIEPKGSSSLYRARVLSALDIELVEPSSTQSQKFPSLEDFYQDILLDNHPSAQQRRFEIGAEASRFNYAGKIRRKAAGEGITYELAVEYLLQIDSEHSESSPATAAEFEVSSEAEQNQATLFEEELTVFRSKTDREEGPLIIANYQPTVGYTAKLFSSIGLVKSLREIRVLDGFTRGKGEMIQSIDQGANPLGWAPCIEAFGEGIYFEVCENLLARYFDQHGEDMALLVAQQQAALRKLNENFSLNIPDSPLFILVHTLSHLLIRQLTFNSGYSSSALRERVYVDERTEYAGILIYTTDTDSEGTMGGLVDQGRAEVIERMVGQLRDSAYWCSADPVCRESLEQGFQGLNRSACHCCSLISETSCQHQNAMLNRLTLGGMGRDKKEPLGLFEFVFGA
jgi:hypothetical protein